MSSFAQYTIICSRLGVHNDTKYSNIEWKRLKKRSSGLLSSHNTAWSDFQTLLLYLHSKRVPTANDTYTYGFEQLLIDNNIFSTSPFSALEIFSWSSRALQVGPVPHEKLFTKIKERGALISSWVFRSFTVRPHTHDDHHHHRPAYRAALQ